MLGSPRYRRLTFMMLDDDIVAVSPATTYRVLKAAGRLDRNRWAPSRKGTGFVQPDAPHCHSHTDVSHVNLGGTFYFLITVLDGYRSSVTTGRSSLPMISSRPFASKV